MGDIGRGTGGLDLAAQPIGVISLVGDDDDLVQIAQQASSNRAITGLAWRQDEFERLATGVGQGVDLGRRPD